ncbi:PPM family protein phosphatase [Gammaproteobacteria bacterium]
MNKPKCDEMLEIACKTDVGCVRPHNEDSIAVDSEIGLLVLADGMGGYQAGEVASGIATDLVVREMRAGILQSFSNITVIEGEGGPPSQTRLLRRAIEHANAAIYEASSTQIHLSGMGTTVVAVLFWADKASIAHVGDSRLYRLRGSTLQRITKDHSLVQELIDHGFYTPEQARTSPQRHLVTRALGLEGTVRVEASEIQVESEDIFLLCSDGLTDMVSDENICLVVKTLAGDLMQAAEQLVEIAKDQGGRDNISVVLARMRAEVGRSWKSRFQSWVR